MRLLELVVGDKTRKAAIETITQFCDVNLGTGVVCCNDTPGFIANRLGIFWLHMGLNAALAQNVPVEVADAVISRPVAIPTTWLFSLFDLVGVDLLHPFA